MTVLSYRDPSTGLYFACVPGVTILCEFATDEEFVAKLNEFATDEKYVEATADEYRAAARSAIVASISDIRSEVNQLNDDRLAAALTQRLDLLQTACDRMAEESEELVRLQSEAVALEEQRQAAERERVQAEKAAASATREQAEAAKWQGIRLAVYTDSVDLLRDVKEPIAWNRDHEPIQWRKFAVKLKSWGSLSEVPEHLRRRFNQ